MPPMWHRWPASFWSRSTTLNEKACISVSMMRASRPRALDWRTMFRPRTLFAPALLAIIAVAAPPATAEELNAEQIIEKALSQGSAVAFQQGTASLTMTIVNAQGQEKKQSLDIKAAKDDKGLLRSLVRFTSPAGVAGVSFRVLEKKDALPDQFVYIPATKQIRQITAGSATSSFFGSDFTFVDLMPLPADQRDQVKITRLPDGSVGKQKTYVIEAAPQVAGSPYSKLVVHVDQKMLIPLKIEFFDPAKKALKTLSIRKLKKMKGEVIPVDMVMKNVQKNTRTELVIEKLNPDAKLTDADFTDEAMKR